MDFTDSRYYGVSTFWLKISLTLFLGTSYWQPMVARQFLRQSPFGRVPQPPRLLTQVSSASLQPTAAVRRRSPPRRTTSFRRGREVKFAEMTIAPEPAVWRGPRLQPELVPLVSPLTFSPTHTSPSLKTPWPLTERTDTPHTTDF